MIKENVGKKIKTIYWIERQKKTREQELVNVSKWKSTKLNIKSEILSVYIVGLWLWFEWEKNINK